MNTLRECSWRLSILVAGIIIAVLAFMFHAQGKISAAQFLMMVLGGIALAIFFSATLSFESPKIKLPKFIFDDVKSILCWWVAVYAIIGFLYHASTRMIVTAVVFFAIAVVVSGLYLFVSFLRSFDK